MALPPSPMPAAAPMAAPDAAPPADMPMGDDAAMDEPAPVLFTVMGPPEGPYTLMAGDEPEGEGDMAAAAPTFDTPQALMEGIRQILAPADGGAEKAFGDGFNGKGGDTAMKPPAGPMA